MIEKIYDKIDINSEQKFSRRQKMLYDIRTSEKAAATLEILTGVNREIWLAEQYKNQNRIDYTYADDDVKNIITKHGGNYPDINELEMVVTHITTSSEKCSHIRQQGIVDLVKAYEFPNNELRQFLERHEIDIDIEECCLTYKKRTYDISYGKCPQYYDNEAYAAWSIGRKFYYDFTVCGFLSISKNDVYGGWVHCRPEILSDIDALLGTRLSDEWEASKESYAIVFKVPVSDTIYNGWDSDTEFERVKSYLYDAYICICIGPNTKEILCKNGIEILPNQILECYRFQDWDS